MAASRLARQALEVVAGRWVPDVLDRLSDGPMRYSELQHEIEGVASSVLTRTLRRMERDGLIARAVHPAVPLEVVYSLTPLGASLDEPLTALALWADCHLDDVAAARRRYARGDE